MTSASIVNDRKRLEEEKKNLEERIKNFEAEKTKGEKPMRKKRKD